MARNGAATIGALIKVALHVLEEFMELISDESRPEQNTLDSSDEDDAVFALS